MQCMCIDCYRPGSKVASILGVDIYYCRAHRKILLGRLLTIKAGKHMNSAEMFIDSKRKKKNA